MYFDLQRPTRVKYGVDGSEMSEMTMVFQYLPSRQVCNGKSDCSTQRWR